MRACTSSGGSEDHVRVLRRDPDHLAYIGGRKREEHEQDQHGDAHLAEGKHQAPRGPKRIHALLEVGHHVLEAAAPRLDGIFGCALEMRDV